MTDVAVIGLGVIGGSLTRALVAQGSDVRACSASRTDRQLARADGLRVHDTIDAALVADADAVVIAVPLDRIAVVARTVRPLVRSDCVLMHAGSLQQASALGMSEQDGEWLIATHPLAGSEGSGYSASRPDLFADATVSADASASPAQRRIVAEVWTAAGVQRVIWQSAQEHDRVMTWASHLPQLVSTALALAIARANVASAQGGPGLRDTTRLAGSSLLMWRPILDANPVDCISALKQLEGTVAELRSALETGDQELLSEMWTTARTWKTAGEHRDAR